MRGFAPRWLMSSQGLLAAGDPHARDGFHLRVHPSTTLGLPIAPLVVYRLPFKKPAWREDIVWKDSHGTVLTLPFDVTPDNPVEGLLPAPHLGVCGWFGLEANLLDTGLPSPGVARVARGPVRRLAARRPHSATAAPASNRPSTATVAAGLQLQAQVMTARGWATASTRSAYPWVVSATPIERVWISGHGRVTAARWIDVRTLPDNIDQALARLTLPLQHARRYESSFADAEATALGQATRVAPLRWPLQEVPPVAGPAQAPLWDEAQEAPRLQAMAGTLLDDLQALMDDPGRQLDVNLSEPLLQDGLELGTLQRPLLAGTLLAAQDVRVARWLGLASWDDTPPFEPLDKQPDNGLTYHIVGYWEIEQRDGEYGLVEPLDAADPQNLGRSEAFHPLPSDARVFLKRTPLANDMKGRGLAPPAGPLGPVALLHTTVVVLAGDPMADAPGAPVIDALEQAEPPWLPGTAPVARRRASLSASALVPGAGLALARRSDALPLWLPLNPGVNPLWRPMIVPGAPATAAEPGHAVLGDRDAPPLAADYRLAQADTFGRWSPWAEATLAAGVRPPPPRPVIEAFFTPAEPPDPPGDAPLAGSIRVSVAVPAPADLPPGAHLLAQVHILFDGVEVASAPPGSGPTVVGTRPGPWLAPTARRTVVVSAQWEDTAGQRSSLSWPVSLACYDLRPPPQAVLPIGLQYASRADATGHGRAEIAWASLPGQTRFRVYAAHETALRTRLEDLGEHELLAQLDALPAPERAALLRSEAVRTLMPRGVFELLTATPVEPVAGQARFEHALSAALAGITCYRVVALAETNVEAAFEPADLLPVAVPNTPAPVRPALELAALAVPLADGRSVPGVRVRLQWPASRNPALAWRLFRSTEETRDVARMPLLAEGLLPASGALPGVARTLTLLLVGDAAPGTPDPAVVGDYDELRSADIRPWMRYHFRADARGASEPGSGLDGTREVPGVWSDAALPVSVLVPDPLPPQAASALGMVRARKQLRWQHAQELRGRHAGPYRFDVYRTPPGGREAPLGSVAGDAPAALGGRDAAGWYHLADPQAVTGTRYRIVLSDPWGRPSPSVDWTLTASARR
jgi:hypothetical protein